MNEKFHVRLNHGRGKKTKTSGRTDPPGAKRYFSKAGIEHSRRRHDLYQLGESDARPAGSAQKVTPDLLEARIYLSFFQVKDQKAMLKKVEDRSWEIKKELTARVGKLLRRMPELRFFVDDTLDHVFKMEELFKKINTDQQKTD